jgi:hypothetical protein
MNLDHIAISGETLAEARAHVEEALGVSMQPGGEHDVFFTHNALLGLEDGLYLETIAINPAAPHPARPRWFDLDRFEGAPRLTNWICRSDDVDADLAALPMALGAPVALQRGALRWRMAVPENGILPYDNCAPALIQWQTTPHPAALLAPSGVRLRRLTIRHPHADELGNKIKPRLRDLRVVFEGGACALEAAFDTPHGPRTITG